MPTRTLAQKVREGFPRAVPVQQFVAALQAQCEDHGFTASNALLLAGVCRDEVCFPFVARLEEVWGPAFHLDSLGGLITIGRTGFSAAAHHAPDDVGGPLRYIVVAAAHIGMDDAGSFGYLRREHQTTSSRTCGALMAFRDELLTGRVSLWFDPADPEMSLLRQRILSALPYGEIPEPVELTELVAQVIAEDLDALLTGYLAELPVTDEVRLIEVTGVLVHTQEGDWFSSAAPRLWNSREDVRVLSLAPGAL